MKSLRLGLIIATLATLVGAAPAHADPNAAIVGTVTDGVNALPGICVDATDEWGSYLGSATTNDTGGYSIEALEPGTYKVRFQDCNYPVRYVTEWFDNQTDLSHASDVVVADSSSTQVDAALSLGAIVAGTVTDDGSHAAISDLCVQAVDANWNVIATAWSDNAGAYSLGAIPTGTVKVSFGCGSFGVFVPLAAKGATPVAPRADRYIGEWYNDKPDFGSADTIDVVAPATTTGIDAALTLGGSIIGVVTNAAGDPLGSVCVDASARNGASYGWGCTDFDGGFRIDGLRAGTFDVHFSDCNDGSYQDEWFDNVRTYVNATGVAVHLGEETRGIDAALALRSRPDLAVAGLTVEPVPLRTDLSPLVPTGTNRRVTVDLANLGNAPDNYGRLFVWVETIGDHKVQNLGSEDVSLAGGASRTWIFDWNAVGTVGDVDVHAQVCSYDDPNRSNNARVARHYSILGGTGYGARVQDGEFPETCYEWHPRI